jgi:nitrogenase molybdenum-iron protein beta chain
LSLIIGSSNEEEVSSLKEVQFIVAAFPIKDRLIFNRAYAGYRGSLTLIEDLYDNL